MSATLIAPKFSFSYPTLEQLGDKFAILVQRDMADLAIFGIDNQQLTDLQARVSAFKNHLNDFYYQGNVSIAVEEKNKFRNELQAEARRLLSRYELAFGRQTARFVRANIGNMSQLSDRELASRLRSLLNFAADDLPQLITAGQTAANLSDIQLTLQAFNEAIDNIDTEIMHRDNATQTRIELANSLYEMITRVALAGKTTFADSDEARWNDYVIYDRPRRSTARTIIIPANSSVVVLAGTTKDEEIYAEVVAASPNVLIAASDNNSAVFDTQRVALNAGQNAVLAVAALSDGNGFGKIIVHNPANSPAEVFVDKYHAPS